MITLIIWLCLLTLLAWGIWTYLPAPAPGSPPFKMFIMVVIFIVMVGIVLRYFGVSLGEMPHR